MPSSQFGLNLSGLPQPQGGVPLISPVNRQAFAAPSALMGQAPASSSVGGILRLQNAASVLEAARQANEAAYQEQQAAPALSGLAGYITRCWTLARNAKQIPERQMLDALASRRGEYTPTQAAELAKQGGSHIFMMIHATKARGASALFRDVLIGAGADKPWTMKPTPVADLPEDVTSAIISGVAQEVAATEAAQGLPVDESVIAARLQQLKDDVTYMMEQEAKARAARVEKKLEDQLVEGGYLDALNDFLDDLTTFKTAIIQGPIIRKRPRLKWVKGPDGRMLAQVVQSIVREWKRVDPLMIYPAPWASHIQDAWLIHRHKLTRSSLTSMIGVDSYSEAAIRKVLELYGTGGLRNWLQLDSERARIEGKDQTAYTMSDTIDALQFVGPVSGSMLLEWGMDSESIPDPAKEYNCDVWMVGPHIIKASLNANPLGRRNYYATSYEPIPGCFWGNSLFDLIRDCCDMCNASARSLANNMGISSGPQVGINIDRLPAGTSITEMVPWQIWQFTSDPMGNTTQPAMQFFSPESNAQELMAVFEKFSTLADEYSGVPRYMTGTDGTPGAGRTATGMSMMITNASKIIKQSLNFVDMKVIEPMVEDLYIHNMQWETDPDLQGDLVAVAKGVLSLTQRETAVQRRHEFLNATNNPVDMQIIGADGRAYLLRESAKELNVDADKVVPSLAAMQRRQILMQAQAASQAANQASVAPPGDMQPTGAPGMQQPAPQQNRQTLGDGSPIADLNSMQRAA